MSIISRKFDKKETGTVFRHAENGKILCRLDARLDSDDWEALLSLINLNYNAGVNAGSEQRAAEIREALGLQGGNNK
ncbi:MULTISPECIES: hypothetical protein [unclassified Klebsiella]|uniref:hypothetical protein n=1 Tax=unclassified Klebsiella TaxID=2608929 RepID=UPI0015DCD014|nr:MULTISPECIES: hypothetical protein [unclassified Klebsiella]BBQ86634.1 hypothetical protein WP3W18E02_P20480 [Klebsiella sp. WP3-W18-ESBL-02]BBR23753.1 hypothetical protein WP3S18E05_P20880 [Klebsiella sp. WP3-S18-ESBL-05]BBV68743.1 hypothetical protein STW0522KLE44_P20200 [Klebsiella sp. STW0522-44]